MSCCIIFALAYVRNGGHDFGIRGRRRCGDAADPVMCYHLRANADLVLQVVPMFSPVDLYEDICFPGGVEVLLSTPDSVLM